MAVAADIAAAEGPSLRQRRMLTHAAIFFGLVALW
jgi:hypothetical protein